MKVKYEASFHRDLKAVRDKALLKRLAELIEAVKAAEDIRDLSGIKKLRGFDSYFRFRIGDHRVGVEIVDDEVVFVRFLNRRDVYRFFP